MPITFSRDIIKSYNVLSIENAENEQNNLFKELRNLNKVGKRIEKIPFIENKGFLFETRENVLYSFKSNGFPIRSSII